MSDDLDLDALAESRLDGELDDARWRELEAAHGAALAGALARARAVRGAVAAFERPTLPPATRAAILGAAPAPASAASAKPKPAAAAPLRFPWRVLLPTALAAGLVVAIVATLGDGGPAPDAAAARRDEVAGRRTHPAAPSAEQKGEERSVLALDDEAAAAPPASVPLALKAMKRDSGEADRLAGSGPKPGADSASGGAVRPLQEPTIGAPAWAGDASADEGALAMRERGEAMPEESQLRRSDADGVLSDALESGAPAAAAAAAAPAAPAAAVASAPAPASSAASASVEPPPGASVPSVATSSAPTTGGTTGATTDAEYAALLEQARAFAPDTPPAGEATPPSPLGLSLTWVAADPVVFGDAGANDAESAGATRTAAKAAPRDGAGQALAQVEKGSRALTLTLRNGTVGDVVLPPGSLALHGYDRVGRAIWQSPVRADRATELPGGGTTSWQEILDAPAAVVEVRLQWGPHRSEPLPLGR